MIVLRLDDGTAYAVDWNGLSGLTNSRIIDPAKVTKAALDNAVSIAGMVLTTNCLVTDIKENDATAQAAAASGMY